MNSIVHPPSLSRFEILAELGRGGMGVVYEALDRASGLRIALKTLKHLSGQTLYLFKQEFRALRDVHHPNLIRLGELLEDNGTWCFTMELIEGVSLFDFVCESGAGGRDTVDRFASTVGIDETLTLTTLSEERLVPRLREDQTQAMSPEQMMAHHLNELRLRTVLPQLVAAVRAIHSAGKVHRDIKPSNIMVTAEGRVVLLDFGLIVDREGVEQLNDVYLAGTPAYMAPELILAESVGPESDWYSVGATLYELLCGSAPYRGPRILQAKRESEPPPPAELNRCAPADLSELCMKLLAIDPHERPDGDAILQRLGFEPDSEGPRKKRDSFVGRAQQLGELRGCTTGTKSAEPVVIVVSGESGVGKSALVQRFAHSLKQDSTTTLLYGRCREHESLPYNALDGIVDALSKAVRRHWPTDATAIIPRHVSLLRQTFPVLRRIEGVANAPEPEQQAQDPAERRRRVFSALREMLARISDHRRLVLMVDDLQWADEDSLLLLAALVQPPSAPPLTFIATARSAAVPRIMATLPVAVQEIDVPRLSPDEATELVRHAAGIVDEGRLESIVTEGDGHPLFLAALARYAAGNPNAEREIGALDDALRARMVTMPPAVQHLVELASIAITPMPPSALTTALGLPAEKLAQALTQAHSERLLKTAGGRYADRIEVYHDRIREAVLGGLNPAQKRALHKAVADALDATPLGKEQPESLVYHLEHGGQPGLAAQHAEVAAEVAMEAMAFDLAARLYETAVRLCPGNAPAPPLQLSLANALAKAGRSHDAAVVYRSVAKQTTGKQRRDCLHDAARYFLLAGEREQGNRAARQVLKAVGVRVPWTRLGVIFRLLFLELTRWLAGYPTARAGSGAQDAQVVERFEILMSLTMGYVLTGSFRARLFHLEAMRLTPALDTPRWVRVMIMESGLLAARGGRNRARRAREMSLVLDRHVASIEQPAVSLLQIAGRSVIAFFGADYIAARKLLARTERAYLKRPEINWGKLNTLRASRLAVHLYCGRLNSLRRLFFQYMADAERRGDKFLQRLLVCRTATLWIARGDVRGWHDRCQSLGIADTPCEDWGLLGFFRLSAQCETALVSNVPDGRLIELLAELEVFKASLLARGRRNLRHECAWLLGRLAAALYKRTGRRSFRRKALGVVRMLESSSPEHVQAHAALVHASVLHSDGKMEAACRCLHEAQLVARRYDMPLIAKVAQLRLAALSIDSMKGDARAAVQWLRGQGITRVDLIKKLISPGL